jgi:hypothetical protein
MILFVSFCYDRRFYYLQNLKYFDQSKESKLIAILTSLCHPFGSALLMIKYFTKQEYVYNNLI